MITHLSTNLARRRVLSLIETNTLPLHQTTINVLAPPLPSTGLNVQHWSTKIEIICSPGLHLLNVKLGFMQQLLDVLVRVCIL